MENIRYCAPGHIFCNARRVVLAVDGSEGSAKAATAAFEVAEMTKSKLFILHVVPTPIVEQFALMSDSDSKEVLRRYELQGRKLLEGYKDSAKEYGVDIELILEKGTPSERVVAQCKKIGADLVVMGYTGATGGSKAGLGSATERVMMGTTCPVLIVK
ncbi:universal stress protein [Candidatus Thorarchaeota archaeon]|nr:MAG: universal stress protein [Candidatus Thorarchaeota archaeon]